MSTRTAGGYVIMWPADRVERLKKRGELGSPLRVLFGSQFARDHLGVGPEDLALHAWTLWDKLAKERPDLGHRQPFGCVDEATAPTFSAPMRLDRDIPPELLAELRFVTKRGEVRSLPLVDGKFKKITALQGHFHRLDTTSDKALKRWMDAL